MTVGLTGLQHAGDPRVVDPKDDFGLGLGPGQRALRARAAR